MTFFTQDYFDSKNENTFYPKIEVIFKLSDVSHYHVPITLSNFGYSTYRGRFEYSYFFIFQVYHILILNILIILVKYVFYIFKRLNQFIK